MTLKSTNISHYISLLLILLLSSGQSFASANAPVIIIAGTNGTTVKMYEKFEVSLALENVEIENPYDPADIDVYAHFAAPSGKKIRINGFYDNYENTDQWKVRFSPGETGVYTYQLFVEDARIRVNHLLVILLL
jgi:hypothetical protein